MLLQLVLDVGDGLLQLLLGGDEVLGRVHLDVRVFAQHLAGQRIDLGDALDVVAPELDAVGGLAVGWHDLQGVAAHAEFASLQDLVVAGVLDIDQVAQQIVATSRLPHVERHHHPTVVFRAAQAVNGGDGGDDDHIATTEQGGGGGQAQAVDFLVDLCVFLDVGVGARDVGFGLVVIVVADEVLDGVVGEEVVEFGVELGGQGLVVGQHQGRALHLGDDLGHDVGLARAGGAEEGLALHPIADAGDELADGAGLVAGGPEVGGDLEGGHGRVGG